MCGQLNTVAVQRDVSLHHSFEGHALKSVDVAYGLHNDPADKMPSDQGASSD